MKIFLTGATGFIGRALTRELLAKGWHVVALVRRPESPQAQAIGRMGAALTPGDVTERESLHAAMAGADVVIHNAGHYEFGLDAAGRERMQAINVAGTKRVLGMAHELGIRRTVYVSSVVAYGDSGPQLRDESFSRQAPVRTWYEQTKTDAHDVALAYQQRGLPLIITSPSQVIGPNDHSVWGYFLRLYLGRLLPPTGWAPDTIISAVHVDDLARGIALAAERGAPGAAYFLGGEPLTMRENLNFWWLRPGGAKIRLWLPANVMAASVLPLEPLQRLAGLPAFLSREIVMASINHTCYSSAKARRELGWQHRSARDAWLNTIDAEIALQRHPSRTGMRGRLHPLPDTM
jgi:dihydroflavonol-4-reductase